METITGAQLEGALARLQSRGAWSAEQAAALLAELEAAPPVPGTPERGNRLAEAAAYAGAVLVAAAGALLVGQHWEELGRPGRAAVLGGLTAVLLAVGVAVAAVAPRGRTALLATGQAARRRLASTALIVAAGTGAGTAAVVVPDHGLLAAAVTALVVAIAADAVAPTELSEAGTLGAAFLLVLAGLEKADAPVPAGVLALAALGAAWAGLALASRLLTVPTLGLALGLAVAVGAGVVGAFAGVQPDTAAGLAVLGALAAGGLALYALLRRWPLAAAGALALAVLVLRISSDRLGPAVAVLLAGLVLLGLGALLLLRRRRAG